MSLFSSTETFFQEPFQSLPLIFHWPEKPICPLLKPLLARGTVISSVSTVDPWRRVGYMNKIGILLPRRKGEGVGPTAGNIATHFKNTFIMEKSQAQGK